ncbi:YHS domain-containing (seleno)protein [Humisphaera borealis]|uniref:YHS domain-containing protein n=1 Tax=Humisphaera borealis TaxID=2807512 RepID=A0A7M2WW43_9BACT|nr:YHS domain-containing (seleno)protein [Humisphaera borealis]QOV89544.1 YHS domain-containing protein [Humisphaera borealis]
MFRAATGIALLVVLGFVSTSSAQTPPSPHYNLGKDRLAIEGYDPVSYFGGKAVRGNAKFSAEHKGVIYRFSSEQNRKQFTDAPEKFAPAYGGWCATAMAEGKKVEIDPRNFRITNGRLFLFYKSFFADAQDDWKKDEANKTKLADGSWKKIAGE